MTRGTNNYSSDDGEGGARDDTGHEASIITVVDDGEGGALYVCCQLASYKKSDLPQGNCPPVPVALVIVKSCVLTEHT